MSLWDYHNTRSTTAIDTRVIATDATEKLLEDPERR